MPVAGARGAAWPYRGGVDRRDIGSWLSGPQIDTGLDGAVGYPGERLGLPESGRGSVTTWGRRIGALVIDWFVVLGVSLALVGAPEPGDDTFGLVNLGRPRSDVRHACS